MSSIMVLVSDPWVALIQRGECNFETKMSNAVKFGAKGVVVYTLDKPMVVMTHGKPHPSLSKPYPSLSKPIHLSVSPTHFSVSPPISQ